MVRKKENKSNLKAPPNPSGRLRFAALIRVSTEQQAKQGESLRTQKTDCLNNARRVGGEIVSWYGGQEHATPGYEKTEVNRLLSDAQKQSKSFNAVLVTDADRWSRDNEQSKKGLKIFCAQKIHFFIGATESDLYDPAQNFYLGMSAEVGQFIASNSRRKSLINRIHRAERGCPTSGKLPYGRTFDKARLLLAGDAADVKEYWGVDAEKRDELVEIAKRYIAGERLEKLAEEFGWNYSQLHTTLRNSCGDKWVQTFNSDDLNIHEAVETEVPALLPPKMIAAFKERSQSNKTFTHGHAKYKYLLGRVVFCKTCGYALTGFTNERNGHKYQYYRHICTKRVKCGCANGERYVNMAELDEMVLLHLFQMFGNPVAVQRAIEEAVPNREKLEDSRRRIERIEKERAKTESRREKVIRLFTTDKISEANVGKELDSINKREAELKTEYERLIDGVSHLPDADKIKAVSKEIASRFAGRYTDAKLIAKKRLANHEFRETTWEQKRGLIETVFSGKTPDSKRLGVYVEWNGDNKAWTFDIKGHLIDEEGLPPLSDSRKKAQFGFDESGGGDCQKELLTIFARQSQS